MINKNIDYKINKICEFENKDIERDFQNTELASLEKVTRYSVLAMGVLFFLIFIFDFFYNVNTIEFIRSLIARAIVLFFCVVTFFAVNKLKNYDKKMFIVTVAEAFLFFGYMFILIQQHAQGFIEQSMAVMLIIMVVFVVPNRWIYSVVNALIMLIFFLTTATFYIDEINIFVRIEVTLYLLLCLILCSIFQYKGNRTKRDAFINLEKLEYLSATDNLTGVYNRVRFEMLMKEQIEKTNNKSDAVFSIILLDIDGFKQVNDKYGHIVGDGVLKEVADIVLNNIREGDVFARWGGDEFALLLPNMNIESGIDMIERIRKACEEHCFAHVDKITISVGITAFQAGDDEPELVRRADDMLYEAKRRGKNRVVSSVSISS